MARAAQPIARVRLARSPARLLGLPLLLLIAGAAAAVAGVLLVGGVTGLAVAAGGALLVLLAVLVAVAAFSVRVQVEESVVRVTGLFARKVFLLTPGSLTRIHLRGEGASRVRSGFSLGWANGRAILRDEEDIYLVRLAPTESVILVPTASGRLGIATSDETHLIESLSLAAHARARTEELAAAMAAEEAAAAEAAEAAAAAAMAAPDERPAPSEPDARFMTGIERSLYEERVARERAAAMDVAAGPVPAAASDVSPDATAVAAAAVAPAPAPPVEPSPDAPQMEPRGMFRRPAWAQRRPGTASAGLPALPSPRLPSVSVRSVSLRGRRPRPSWLLPVVPLVAAGVTWGVGVYLEQIPAAGSPTARLTALALVLAGPGTTIGAIMARAWWPRLVGVVVMGGLASAIFIARSLLPP